MYYPSQHIIVTDKTVIDIKTIQKFEFRINRKIMDCYPAKITQQDIQIEYSNPSNFSEKELRERRCEIAKFLKSLKGVKKVIYSFI